MARLGHGGMGLPCRQSGRARTSGNPYGRGRRVPPGSWRRPVPDSRPEGVGGQVRRSNLLVMAGIAFFVVGVIIVALLQRDSGSSSSSSSSTVDVLVAKDDIAAGTNGEDATSKVEISRINASDKQPDALSTPSQLSNQIFTLKFAKGEQIRQGGLRQRSQVSQVPVPQGKEAVAVQVPFVPGGAGYLAPGDTVNVYQVIPSA